MCNGLILFISSQVLLILLSGVVHRAVFNEILSGESIMYRYMKIGFITSLFLQGKIFKTLEKQATVIVKKNISTS